MISLHTQQIKIFQRASDSLYVQACCKQLQPYTEILSHFFAHYSKSAPRFLSKKFCLYTGISLLLTLVASRILSHYRAFQENKQIRARIENTRKQLLVLQPEISNYIKDFLQPYMTGQKQPDLTREPMLRSLFAHLLQKHKIDAEDTQLIKEIAQTALEAYIITALIGYRIKLKECGLSDRIEVGSAVYHHFIDTLKEALKIDFIAYLEPAVQEQLNIDHIDRTIYALVNPYLTGMPDAKRFAWLVSSDNVYLHKAFILP